MTLQSIQLCHIDRVTLSDGTNAWEVTAHSDDQQQHATFRCSTEGDALTLRNAIRERADKLRRVADYRERPRTEPVSSHDPRRPMLGDGEDYPGIFG